MQEEAKADISRIVLGLDGSAGSQAAARWCARLAASTGARVSVVHGLGKLPEIFLGTPQAVAVGLGLAGGGHHPSWREELRRRLEAWCAPLHEAGVDYRAELIDDDAVEALLRTADENHADLIVVGAQGHGAVLHRLLGWIPYKLAHHAHVPVVIVPTAVPGVGAGGETEGSASPAG